MLSASLNKTFLSLFTPKETDTEKPDVKHVRGVSPSCYETFVYQNMLKYICVNSKFICSVPETFSLNAECMHSGRFKKLSLFVNEVRRQIFTRIISILLCSSLAVLFETNPNEIKPQ